MRVIKRIILVVFYQAQVISNIFEIQGTRQKGRFQKFQVIEFEWLYLYIFSNTDKFFRRSENFKI